MKKLLPVAILVLLVVPTTLTFKSTEAETNSYRTIIVPDDYPTIQAALNASIDGDTVFVKKGMYLESPIIYKPIMLVGEDRNTTVIYAGSGLRIKRDNVTLTGFTIHGPAERGISLESSYCNISNNKVTNVTHGLFLFTSKYNIISGNIFESIGSSSAIQLNYASDYNLIENNYISACTEGIQIWLNSGNNAVTKNTITNCKYQAIRLLNSNYNDILSNNITDSGIGISICVSNGSIISHNNFIDNKEQLITDGSLDPSLGYGISENTINENYWSNYNGTGSDNAGIGDIPYIIDDYNKDSNPLMTAIDFTATLPNLIPTPIPTSTSTPSSTLTPSASLTQLPTLSTEPTATVTEFPAWIILPLLLVSVALAAILYRRRQPA